MGLVLPAYGAVSRSPNWSIRAAAVSCIRMIAGTLIAKKAWVGVPGGFSEFINPTFRWFDATVVQRARVNCCWSVLVR